MTSFKQALIACLRTAPCDDPNYFPFLHWKLSRADVEWLLTHPIVDTDKLEKSFEMMLTANETNIRELEATNFRRELYGLLQSSRRIDLRGADLVKVNLSGLNLAYARLEYADLMEADLRGAFLINAHLEHTHLLDAHLEQATLTHAHLEGSVLHNAHLECANLEAAHLEGADLRSTHLEGANLKGTYFDSSSNLEGIHLSNREIGSAILDIVHWEDVDLSVVDWEQMKVIGDEQRARQLQKKHKEELKTKSEKSREYKRFYRLFNIRLYKAASRANIRLSVMLQEQGLEGDAARFSYNAKILQRVASRWDHKYGQWLFSILLAALTGYGYKMWRIFIVYSVIVSFSAIAYFILGMFYPPHIPLLQAFLESITAFHGRVFSEVFDSYTPQIWVTAFEAVAGLVVEGIFIAMLTQRFFRK